jgi:predicted negative regulator of RcsB-dependent stress response
MTGAHLTSTLATTLTNTVTASGASSVANLTAIWVSAIIVVPFCIAIAVIGWCYFRLQRHRADAVAMASYRRLAEDAVANMTELRAEMTKLAEHVSTVEQLMRDVG